MAEIPREVSDAFKNGLLGGYASGASHEAVWPDGLRVKMNYSAEPGVTYLDQWSPGRVGGGVERVYVKGKKYLRLYAGGIAPENYIANAGTTRKEVLKFLKETVTELEGATRLDERVTFSKGGWLYSYVPSDTVTDDRIGLTVSTETITKEGIFVFKYVVMITPILSGEE